MNKAIELRLRHTELVIQGKTSEADKVLRQIWDLDKGINPKAKVILKKEVIKKSKSKYNSFKDLTKIKGIGKETIKDIKRIYKNDFKKLVEDINSKKDLPLRNDVSKKLIKVL